MISTPESSLLEKFGATIDAEQSGLALPRLLAEPQLSLFLGQVCQKLAAPSLEVAASLFSKYYARACCLPLYLWSRHGLMLPVRLTDIFLCLTDEAPKFSFLPPLEASPTGRVQLLNALCLHNWQPFVSQLMLVTGLREQLLWENFFVYVRHYYEEWLGVEADNPVQQRRLREDYAALTYFFQAKLLRAPEMEDSLCFYRKTCCYRYQLPEGQCCKICPRLGSEK